MSQNRKRWWLGEDPKGPFPKPIFNSYPEVGGAIKYTSLDETNLTKLLTNFTRSTWKKHPKRILCIQLRCKIDGSHFSIGKVERLRYDIKSDRAALKQLLLYNLTNIYQNYTEMNIQYIYVRYAFLSEKESVKVDSTVQDSLAKAFCENDLQKLPEIKNILNLPATLNYDTWGYNITRISNKVITIQSKTITGEKVLYLVSSTTPLVREISVLNIKTNKIVLQFKDTIIDKDNDSYLRDFHNGVILEYVNGQRINKLNNEQAMFITPVKSETDYKFGACTLDLETRRVAKEVKISGKTTQTHILEVVSAAWYYNGIAHTYYICDYKNSKTMINHMISDLYATKIEYPVYIHNLSRFDAMFLLSALADRASVYNTTIKDGKIISLLISINNTTISFRDSLLLLPMSLSKLAKGFGVTEKGAWDPTVQDSCVNLESIREELLAYNVQDCVVLYEVLEKFSLLAWDMFDINLGNVPTLTSLAFRVYRSIFMKAGTQIHVTDQKLYNTLKSGYFGGAVDVYQPFSKQNQRVYGYDINSLYPTVMKKYTFPTGSPTHVYNPVQPLDEMFGFVLARVTCPTTIKCPILMTRLNGRSIAATGTWQGWFFTEELKYAESLGYTYEITEAILYMEDKIFAKYVETLYDLRTTFSKNDPRNLICKLLLNSLYGRFGMSPYLTDWKLHPKDKNSISLASRSVDFMEFENTMLLATEKNYNKDLSPPLDKNEAIQLLLQKHNLTYKEFQSDFLTNKDLRKEFNALTSEPDMLNISLPISMAVTAYARIEIHRYKSFIIESGGTLFYSDTDSIYSSIPLDPQMIGKELGEMKLEFVARRGIFLAPKVYAVELFRPEDLEAFSKGLVDGKYLIKIKGVSFTSPYHKPKISFNNFIDLLAKGKIVEIVQERMSKATEQSTIRVLKLIYNLRVTENKRRLLTRRGFYFKTMPYHIVKNKIVDK